MNEAEKKIVHNIEKYGCHITSVFDPDGEDPNFSYSTGISKTYNAPELIVIGLSTNLSQSIINTYANLLKEKREFEKGEFYKGFLEGFEITFREVSEASKKEHMLSACWFHENKFEALQLVYPTTKGVWPWDPEATKSFHSLQPSLAEKSEW